RSRPTRPLRQIPPSKETSRAPPQRSRVPSTLSISVQEFPFEFELCPSASSFRKQSQYQPIGASSRLTNTCFVSRYSSSPHGPSSRPNPDCLYPPQGASTYVGCM